MFIEYELYKFNIDMFGNTTYDKNSTVKCVWYDSIYHASLILNVL